MQKRKIIYCLFLTFCFSMAIEKAAAQVNNAISSGNSPEVEKVLPKIHSMYIYQLTKYFLWPEGFSQEKFYIGVYGREGAAVRNELEVMAKSLKANGQEIGIKQFDTADEISLDCHIVYVPYESSNFLNEVLMRTQQHPVLVISAKEGLGKVGSPVNLITIDGKTSFELNEDAIEKRTLKFVQQLKAIAIML